MRIIAGKARGRKILSPLNEGRDTKTGEVRATRPTLDRVKEAMFSIISQKIVGANTLDLFAGTGSLGLEAASRGAKRIYLVDSFRETYDLLVENITILGFNEECISLYMDYHEALKKLSAKGEVFDLVFIDPPYLNEMIPTAMKYIHQKGMLAKNGVVVTKVDSTEEPYQGIDRLKIILKRKYGNTTLVFYQSLDEEGAE